MTDRLTQHELTEKFFDLTLLFELEMQQKTSAPLLYQGQGNILMALGEQDGQSQKALSQRLKISAPSTTEFVSKLVKKGLVKKQRSEKDKRVTLISLTDAGRKSLQTVDQADISAWQLLTESQQKQFGQLMDTLITKLTAQYSDPESKQQLAGLRRRFVSRA